MEGLNRMTGWMDEVCGWRSTDKWIWMSWNYSGWNLSMMGYHMGGWLNGQMGIDGGI